MSNLTSFDWWLATYLVAAGFGYGEPAEFGKNRTLRFSGHP